MKIRCYCDLYTSDELQKRKNEILMKLMNHEFSKDIYIITLPECDHNQLEFYASTMLMQPAYEDSNIFIVGIAESYQEAKDLIEQITIDVLKHLKEPAIRRYIEKQQQAFDKEHSS